MQLGFLMIDKLDVIALCWFLFVWFAYAYLADIYSEKSKNLVTIMEKYRIQWMRQMIKRPDHLLDLRIIANLSQSTSFLASTSMLLIAGTIAALGYGEKGVEMMNKMGLTGTVSVQMWSVKTGLLVFIFIYAFFKATWVMRQFNFASVLIAATPAYHENGKMEEVRHQHDYANRVAMIVSNAAKHFNMAIRSYYFGLAALAWYIHAYCLIGASIVVVLVIYRREFMSKTLKFLV